MKRLTADRVESPTATRGQGGLSQRISATIYWPLALLIAGFASTSLVVPLLAPISIGDDWVYAKSVEILMSQGKIQLLDVSSAVNPFQTLWAGLFALLFGTHLGVFRLSTFALVIISAPAFYGVCRELGTVRPMALLGTALYLFNPIYFSLAYTFMSDAHFISLLVISLYFYLRGFQTDSTSSIVVGSAIAACAFLVRQHGFFLPVGVMTYFLLARRLSFNVQSLRFAARVLGIPVVVAGAYLVWITAIHGVPAGGRTLFTYFLEAPFAERIHLLWRMTFITLMYLGLFMIPLAVSIVPRAVGLIKSLSAKGLAWIGVCLAILLGGLVDFAGQGRLMPYIPDGLNRHGIGPSDMIGGRPPIVDTRTLIIFTVIVAMSSVALVISVAATPEPKNEGNVGGGLLLSIASWQALALYVVSHWFRKFPPDHPIISVDRYVIVLLPFAIWFCLGRMRKLTLPAGAAWVVVALIAGFSAAGTRDFLVFHRSVWELAALVGEAGIPKTKLDAGAAWDGYNVSDGSYFERETKTPNPPPWIPMFAPDIDSTYLISTTPVEGYSTMSRHAYSRWLASETAYIYLSKRLEQAPR